MSPSSIGRERARRTARACPRVAAPEDRVEEPAVAEAVLAGAQPRVSPRCRDDRIHRDEVERDPDLGVRAPHGEVTSTAQPCERRRWCARRARRRRSCGPGACTPEPVPEPRGDPRLVVRDPVPDPVAEPRDDDLGVFRERLDGLARRPAALVLERLREVPVVQRHERLDAVREQVVDEPVVEVEARLVHAPAALGQDARPRDREAERAEAELSASARCPRAYR